MDNLHLFKNNFINKYQCFGWHGKLFIHVKMLYAVSVGKNTLKKISPETTSSARSPMYLGVGPSVPLGGAIPEYPVPASQSTSIDYLVGELADHYVS